MNISSLARTSAYNTPENMLWFMVLVRAIRDLFGPAGRHKATAVKWFYCPVFAPGSLRWVLQQLNLPISQPSLIRRLLCCNQEELVEVCRRIYRQQNRRKYAKRKRRRKVDAG